MNPKLKNYNIAIVGATGNVGLEFLKILEPYHLEPSHLFLVASKESEGKKIKYNEYNLDVKSIDQFDFSQCQIALFSPGASVSAVYAPKASESGCFVIDNTSYFRMLEDIPLVVPEINAFTIKRAKRRIIANPNCSTIQLVMALKPIDDFAPIRRVVVSTYQAVSGAGRKAVEMLKKQTQVQWSDEQTDVNECEARKPIAYNVIPQIDVFLDDGSTKEEWKMVVETKKILRDDLSVAATCVRVPVFNGHSESVNIEFESPVALDDIYTQLNAFPGVQAVRPESSKYITPIEVNGKDDVFVSRIRQDLSVLYGVQMWIVSDNLRKGAALNAIQIAEKLIDFKMVN